MMIANSGAVESAASDVEPVIGPPSRFSRPVLRAIGFRFVVLYLALYSVGAQILHGLFRPLTAPVINGVALHIFGVIAPQTVSGSGDRAIDWISALIVLVTSVAGTAIWSALDRRHVAYPNLSRRLRVFVRFALASQLLSYGAMKLIPVQMPAPSLTRLLEPYGDFSPMGVLWASIGASSAYQHFAGAVEMLAGILLVIPRTAVLGAVVSLAVTVQVFVLNLTYDVPVKLFSFHLVLHAAFLLAYSVRDLAAVMFARGAGARWAAIAQMSVGAAMTVLALVGATNSWRQLGGGVPRPPLYGIWTIDSMRIDGADLVPLMTDVVWRHIVIQANTRLVFWRTNNTPTYAYAAYDMDARTIAISGGPLMGTLTFERPDLSHLILDGQLSGRLYHIETTRMDERAQPLMQWGVHWIQEFPVNH